MREALTRGEQMHTALNRAFADHTRVEAERDALQATVNLQKEELARARGSLGAMTEERAKLAAQNDAHQLLLADYRTRLGLGGAAG